MDPENYIVEALERVLVWDLPDECLADAIAKHSELLAGLQGRSSDQSGVALH